MVIWAVLFVSPFLFSKSIILTSRILQTLKFWIPSLVALGSLSLLILWINISLFWYPTSPAHPIDTLFVHVPMRLFMLALLVSALPQNLFIALDWVYSPDHPERDYNDRTMEAFTTIIIIHVLGLFWVILKRDLLWAAGAVYTMIALMSKRPKPFMVFAALITFSVLYPLFWLAASTYHTITRQGAFSFHPLLPPPLSLC